MKTRSMTFKIEYYVKRIIKILRSYKLKGN